MSRSEHQTKSKMISTCSERVFVVVLTSTNTVPAIVTDMFVRLKLLCVQISHNSILYIVCI